MKQTFYSNGKLLLTGEYVVLDGAIAFSLPTKFGQNLVVETTDTGFLDWKSYDSNDEIWLEEKISFEEILSNSKTGESKKDTLVFILHCAHRMNSEILQESKGFAIETKLTFPRNWGLGSSSTLINNIAQWFEIDAFELLEKSFGGSGYDIANAQNTTAILYTIGNGNRVVKSFVFQPEFSKNLHFVYLNEKQSSKDAIASYHKKKKTIAQVVKQIDEITREAIACENWKQFARLMAKHESILSSVLETIPVQQKLFSDFDGVVKSLGAWGGDFVMAISEKNPKEYFKEKGFETVLSYKEMILR